MVMDDETCSVRSGDSIHVSVEKRKPGRPKGSKNLKRRKLLDIDSIQPMNPDLVKPVEVEIQSSVLCSCNTFSNLFVTDLPEEIDANVVFSCYRHVPTVQWNRKEFMSCIENICRFHRQDYGNCLWGNRLASDFTISSGRMKAEALIESVNRFQGLAFEHDGPQMLFTVFSRSMDLDPRLLDVIKVFNVMRNGGKTGCLTSCCVPTDRTCLSYRGDNSSNKAKQVNIKIERQSIEDLNAQLYNDMDPSTSPYISQLCQDDGVDINFVKSMFMPSHQASSMNYHLRVNNVMESESCVVVAMSCLEARVEMRLFECVKEGETQVWVAQSVSVRTVAGVNPYSVFLETLSIMSKEVQLSVHSVLDGMVKCLNRGSALSHDDMHSMIQWLTAPAFLCVMVNGWQHQNDVEIVTSDIPIANEAFVKIMLSYVNKELSLYVKEIETKMNQCKQSTKNKQPQVVANTIKMFRGAYIQHQEDGWNLVAAALPPASFSYGIHLNVDWVKEDVTVMDLSKNCLFSTILNVICNPHMILSDTFINEMKNMRSSLKYLRSLESTEAKWVVYMMDNVSDYVSTGEYETFNKYLRFIGQHDPTNRMFAVLMNLSFKTKQYTSIYNTVNLIRYQLDTFLKCHPNTVNSNTSRLTQLLKENQHVMDRLVSELESYRTVFPEACMSAFTNLSIQNMLSSVNKVFRFKNCNLNLLWVLMTSTLSFVMPNEPAWATTIMLVDSACQAELIVQDKGRVKILGISGSKRDSTGFNFVLGCFKQLVTACNTICGVEAPELVASNSSFTDGKKKRMGLTVAFLNNKTICWENSTNIVDYGVFMFIPEDCHKLLWDTGMAKNFLRDACVKRSGFRITENFNMKLILMEEPRIVLMATNKKDSEQGDVFSLAARMRFWPSAVPDELVPLSIDQNETDIFEYKTSVAKVKVIKSLEMSLNAKFTHLCNKEYRTSTDSLDFNQGKIMQNLVVCVTLQLSSHVLQILTMAGFRLYCNESVNVSRSIMQEINYFLYTVITPFLSADMNDEDRFMRKQEGLMLSHAVPMHVFSTVYKNMVASVAMNSRVDIDRVVNESIVQLLCSDMDSHVIFSAYCANITFETVMYVVFRSVLRIVEFPGTYSINALVRVVKNKSWDGLSTEDKRGLMKLKSWLTAKMRYLVTMRDLNQRKAKDEVHDVYGKLGLVNSYDSGVNRSLFITCKDLFASACTDEEMVDKNMWIFMQKFIVMLPEVQNSFKSFCLRRELITADLLSQLFAAKKMDRRCINTLFRDEDVNMVSILQALGVDESLIPRNWSTLSLHNTLRDEGSNNSNVFSLVQVGTNGCCLGVNLMSIVLLGPFFCHNKNILHLLQQKDAICRIVEQAYVNCIPRMYWPNDNFNVIQMNHTGKWITHRMPSKEEVPFDTTYFGRVSDIHWSAHNPSLRNKSSCMLPFCLEETFVCGGLMGLLRRMRDGLDLRDEPFTFTCYMLVVSKLQSMGPWMFFSLVDYDNNRPYVFTNATNWFILTVTRENCKWSTFERDAGSDRLIRKQVCEYELFEIQSVVMKSTAFPVPIVLNNRIVKTSRESCTFLKGSQSTSLCDFGLVKGFDPNLAYYDIEAYTKDSYQVVNLQVPIHRIAEILVPDLERMCISFEYIPSMGFFMPFEGATMVSVYNVVDSQPSVVAPIVACKGGFFDDNAGSMFMEIVVSALVRCEDEDDSKVAPFIAFHQKTQ